MMLFSKHIILIGFKHVGKSVIGRMLAMKMNREHLDLDHEIMHVYNQTHSHKLSCKDLVETEGEAFFRSLEQEVLQQVIQRSPCVISTGGGAPMRKENCELMAPHYIVHITAKPKSVFDRIMKKGRPAFFPENKDPWETFQHLWEEREMVYKHIAHLSLMNDYSVAMTARDLLRKLNS